MHQLFMISVKLCPNDSYFKPTEKSKNFKALSRTSSPKRRLINLTTFQRIKTQLLTLLYIDFIFCHRSTS